MSAPFLVSPPDVLPVTLEQAKQHLRIDHNDDDDLIMNYLHGAISYLDGYSGIMGRALAPQVWQQNFPPGIGVFCLSLGPAQELIRVSCIDPGNQLIEQDISLFSLQGTSKGSQVTAYSLPALARRPDAVQIQYRAGYADAESIPNAVRVAILFLVQRFYDGADKSVDADIDRAVSNLIAPFRLRVL